MTKICEKLLKKVAGECERKSCGEKCTAGLGLEKAKKEDGGKCPVDITAQDTGKEAPVSALLKALRKYRSGKKA